jgi:hypothetical protein
MSNLQYSRTTKRIFDRSQRWEPMYEPEYYDTSDKSDPEAVKFLANFRKRLEAIKPHQKVTKRYILDNQHYRSAK